MPRVGLETPRVYSRGQAPHPIDCHGSKSGCHTPAGASIAPVPRDPQPLQSLLVSDLQEHPGQSRCHSSSALCPRSASLPPNPQVSSCPCPPALTDQSCPNLPPLKFLATPTVLVISMPTVSAQVGSPSACCPLGVGTPQCSLPASLDPFQ